MDQFVSTRDEVRFEQIAETLADILQELRLANRRERERDARSEAERASVREKYARL